MVEWNRRIDSRWLHCPPDTELQAPDNRGETENHALGPELSAG